MKKNCNPKDFPEVQHALPPTGFGCPNDALNDIPVITSVPTQAHKIKISNEQVLNFRIFRLREQIISLKGENVDLIKQRADLEKENLKLRKEILDVEMQSFFKQNNLAPGDKIHPDPEGDGYCIYRPMLERFSVGLSQDPKKS